MILAVFIAIFSLIVLITLHELGHFVTAKKLGVKVEEFGLGYPPRLFGKKFGETLYSINLLPFGGFVRIHGQENPVDDPRSFSTRPIWQRSLIILGGVITFWIIAAILLSVVAGIGEPVLVNDEDYSLKDPKVQILALAPNSPATGAGLEIGDIVRGIKFKEEYLETDKIGQIQEFTQKYKGEEIILVIQRGGEILNISITPRVSSPEDEGPMGVALVRTALKRCSWYKAPIIGIKRTGELTWILLKGWGIFISSLVQGKGIPSGMEVGGPVKIMESSARAWGIGISYFLTFIAVISVALAIVNILPIPALDGGWFVFLLLEKLRGKPVNQKIIQNVSLVFFFLLVALLILVTIKDVRGLL